MAETAAQIRIGISGWRYPPWRGSFYPKGLTQARELEFASRQFPAIELNGSFYALQRPSSYQRWAADTPDGFVFTVKAPRYITHILRLRDAIHPEEVNTPVRRVCYIAQLVLSGDAVPGDARHQLLRGIEQLSSVGLQAHPHPAVGKRGPLRPTVHLGLGGPDEVRPTGPHLLRQAL